jgi:hypothetical protein
MQPDLALSDAMKRILVLFVLLVVAASAFDRVVVWEDAYAEY